MNYLGIDYGTKRIGLAVAVNGIISPLTVIPNNKATFTAIRQIVVAHQIHRVYVGISEGNFAALTKQFARQLAGVLQLPVETIEESVSTIEADQIYRANRGKLKNYRHRIDAVSAAVILNRLSI